MIKNDGANVPVSTSFNSTKRVVGYGLCDAGVEGVGVGWGRGGGAARVVVEYVYVGDAASVLLLVQLREERGAARFQLRVTPRAARARPVFNNTPLYLTKHHFCITKKLSR